MNSDIRGWAEWAASQGWTVNDDAKGYTRFHDPAGNTSPGTRRHRATRDGAWQI